MYRAPVTQTDMSPGRRQQEELFQLMRDLYKAGAFNNMPKPKSKSKSKPREHFITLPDGTQVPFTSPPRGDKGIRASGLTGSPTDRTMGSVNRVSDKE